MATTTTNYGFSKPAAADTTVVRTTYNTALDAIDTAIAAGLPWIVDVDVFPTAIAHTTFDTLSNQTCIYGGIKTSAGNQNDAINFDIVLAAGTWTFELFHQQSTNRGIYTLTLGGAAFSTFGGSTNTIDGYNAASTFNVRSTSTGIVIPATAKRRLTLTMATKNGASSGYTGSIQHIQLRRTA